MSTEQLTREAINLPLGERITLAQRLWQSIEPDVADAGESAVVAEAVRRDKDLTSGVAIGRGHAEVIQGARRRLGCA